MSNIDDEFLLDFEEVTNVGSLDFDDLINRPKYAGQTMTSETNIPEVKTYTEGTGIDITGTKISVDTDVVALKSDLPVVTEYTAGNGLDLNNGEFSVDTDVVALKSDIPTVPEVVQETGTSTTDVMSQKAASDAITTAASGVDTKIGDLTDLTTTAKTNVVAAINEVDGAIGDEATARSGADTNLQGQIDALAASSDVTDIVGTYADLQAYDTQHLKDNDIIKVLQDESQNDETTYYRWSTTTQTFTLIGEEGPYYTKSAADTKFQEKLVAGTNITIAADGKTISATYSDFTGTDGTSAGTAGLVPAPATTDAGKFLKASGSWEKAVAWDNVFADDDQYKIKIGSGATTAGTNAIAIGRGALSRGTASVSIGTSSEANNTSGNSYGTAIGYSAKAPAAYSVAIGANATTTSKGEFAIGTTGTNGYNDSAYRLLTGLYDPQNAHDAATKGYVDGLVGDIETALNIINNGGN